MNTTIRRLLYVGVLALIITGVLYAIPRYADLYFDLDLVPMVAPSLLMKVHGAFALWVTVLLGIIWQAHVRLRMRRPLNRLAGFTLVAILVLLTLTGYLLYYVGSREIREMTSVVHTGLGVAVLVIIVWHVKVAKIIQRRYRAKLGSSTLDDGGPDAKPTRASRTGRAANPNHRPQTVPGTSQMAGRSSSGEPA